MNSTELAQLHAEHIKALTAARLAYDLAVAAYRAAPAGPHKEQSQQAMYAVGDLVNLVQGCAYTTGQVRA